VIGLTLVKSATLLRSTKKGHIYMFEDIQQKRQTLAKKEDALRELELSIAQTLAKKEDALRELELSFAQVLAKKESSLRELKLSVVQLREKLEGQMSSYTPFTLISMEILSDILLHASLSPLFPRCDPPDAPTFETNSMLMLVCKCWYFIVKDNPIFWTSCTFSETREYPHQRQFHAWALRSGNLPLQIHLNFESSGGLFELWRKYAKPWLSRLSTISISELGGTWCNRVEKVGIILKGLQSSASLTCLHLNDTQFPGVIIDSNEPLRLPALRSFIMIESARLLPIIAPTLRKLNLKNIR